MEFMDNSNVQENSLYKRIQRFNTDLAHSRMEPENHANELSQSEERFAPAMQGANGGVGCGIGISKQMKFIILLAGKAYLAMMKTSLKIRSLLGKCSSISKTKTTP